jgi:hypothetical protein
MIEIKDLKKVLKDTGKIIKHQQELSEAKGDHFNLFSVLDIETKENKTHSAFLAELLNPKGSHLKGDVFLKLFLEVLNPSQKLKNVENKSFNAETGVVKVEKSIGPIDLHNKEGEDPSEATGGRIDIYLKDGKDNIISIENKIHALDQDAQIQRYCNHRKKKNTVYYLTLKGEEPSEDSCLKLKAGEDFFNISYRDDIVEWLELCLKEVPNFTGLREAINQYILLIKKLTNTLDTKTEKELFDIISDNLEESKYIVDNYQKLINTIRDSFRNDVKTSLENKLDKEKYTVEVGSNIENSYAQLWVTYTGKVNHKLKYGIESFSGRGNKRGKMYVGIFGKQALPELKHFGELERINAFWQHIAYLKTKDDNSLNLNSSVLLNRIRDKEAKYDALLDKVVKQIILFINSTEKDLGFI